MRRSLRPSQEISNNARTFLSIGLPDRHVQQGFDCHSIPPMEAQYP
ncbi:TPA: hypothetical protein MFO42_18185 [Klebsiella pneumoniae]|uniref:Uncharacterized protein n=1 Tax=Klebsiella pneumoniae TaxID=573 RepID=A0AAW9U8B6_KLEPN|nr:hypothetical protein P243_3432 [Klebsiella pneumoniae subsp. pneumoniae 1158]MRJ95068.1 hypothetical protein [Klebsiella pneumoniae]HBW8966504.1 hypothetical protein [Klebsiella pneumoniae]HBW8976338.1 hypothetical protein [Klebsiella pneumoniae]HBW8988480.1 hypothetical protein [Klebsiella pneumoniae]